MYKTKRQNAVIRCIIWRCAVLWPWVVTRQDKTECCKAMVYKSLCF